MVNKETEIAMLERSRHLAACTSEFLDTIAALRQRGFKDVETIWNTSCHINLLDHDISVMLYFMTTTEDTWAQRTVARYLAAIIYEACDDLSQLLGKSFKHACMSAGCFDVIELPLKAAKKSLSEFSSRHHELLKSIRHRAGAHKEHDVVEFLTAVIEANPQQLVELAYDFSNLLLELAKVCSAAIDAANSANRKKGFIP